MMVYLRKLKRQVVFLKTAKWSGMEILCPLAGQWICRLSFERWSSWQKTRRKNWSYQQPNCCRSFKKDALGIEKGGTSHKNAIVGESAIRMISISNSIYPEENKRCQTKQTRLNGPIQRRWLATFTSWYWIMIVCEYSR